MINKKINYYIILKLLKRNLFHKIKNYLKNMKKLKINYSLYKLKKNNNNDYSK